MIYNTVPMPVCALQKGDRVLASNGKVVIADRQEKQTDTTVVHFKVEGETNIMQWLVDNKGQIKCEKIIGML